MLSVAASVALVIAIGAADAAAHTVMTSPVPRNGSDGLKVGPCGNVAPTGAPTIFAPGETIRLTWNETIDHPGYYRIAFSLAGDDGFDANVLLDDIADRACTAPPCAYDAEVTLPSEPCEGCSLQLIQWMGTAPPYSPYFSCADIALRVGGAPDAGLDAPDAGGADAGGDVGRDAGDDGAASGELAGGCAATRGAGGPWLFVALFALSMVRLRRRRVGRLARTSCRP